MSAFTLAEAQTQLDAWKEASLRTSKGRSYTIAHGSFQRTLSRSDATEIREMIDYWAGILSGLTRQAAGKSRHKFSLVRFV